MLSQPSKFELPLPKGSWRISPDDEEQSHIFVTVVFLPPTHMEVDIELQGTILPMFCYVLLRALTG